MKNKKIGSGLFDYMTFEYAGLRAFMLYESRAPALNGAYYSRLNIWISIPRCCFSDSNCSP